MTTGMNSGPDIQSRTVLDVRVDATSYSDATRRVLSWARSDASRYVCACNVHMVMEAHDDPIFRDEVNGADLVTPDGMPLVWALRALGVAHSTRVYGPSLMVSVCEGAERERIPIGLYGGEASVLDAVGIRLRQLFPALNITYAYSPPFDDDSETQWDLEAISASGARILFVALGCPKQERWMARNSDRIPTVMLGVGAAFDFLAGRKLQAPRIVQRVGMEWAFRLATEPRRLWRRYALHNPRFLFLVIRQVLRNRRVVKRGHIDGGK